MAVRHNSTLIDKFVDLAECLASLFSGCIPIFAAVYFTNNRNNEAVNIGCFIYYFKKPVNKDGYVQKIKVLSLHI